MTTMEHHGKYFYLVLLLCCACASAAELKLVCPLDEELCGYRCYNSSKSDCLALDVDSFYKHYPCPKGHLPCSKLNLGTECYDPMTQKCMESGVICSLDQDGCGEKCYSPHEETCHSSHSKGWPSVYTVCKNGELICHTETCYDPDNFTCHPYGPYHYVLCKQGELRCGYECYSPDSGKLCLEGYALCEVGEEVCGYDCYDPKTQTCNGGRAVCQSWELPCGNFRCYSSQNETCFADRLDDYTDLICPIGLSPCGYICYDPQTQDCLNERMACPIGSMTCGDLCYDDGKKCLDDERGILCNKDEEACGWRCYKPGPGVTCKADYNLVCQNGERTCGWDCYNPETHKCLCPEFAPETCLK